MGDGTFKIDAGMVTAIAKVCYGSNQAFISAIERRDYVSWYDADSSTKESYIDGVFFIVHFFERGGVPFPKDVHGEWLRYRKEKGWVFGDTKDRIKKTDPLMKPWEELTDRQRLPSELFYNTVMTFLKAT